MRHKLKKLGLEFIASATVAFGVGLVVFYLAEEVSFLSIFTGMVGYLILKPAIDYYRELFEEFFKGE